MCLVVSSLAATLSSCPWRMYVQPHEQGLVGAGGATAVLEDSVLVETSSGHATACTHGRLSTLSP
jgi:hypothetical protein